MTVENILLYEEVEIDTGEIYSGGIGVAWPTDGYVICAGCRHLLKDLGEVGVYIIKKINNHALPVCKSCGADREVVDQLMEEFK